MMRNKLICVLLLVLSNISIFKSQEGLSREQRYEQISQNMEEQARDAMRSNQDNNEYAKIQSFDAEATNFERFENSPCYDKIGFNPTWDTSELEQQYKECENEYYFKKTMNIVYITLFIVIVGVVIFFSLSKEKRNDLINKIPKVKK